MTKKWIFYTSIALIIAFICSGFKPLKNEKQSWFFLKKNEALLHLFPSLEPTDYVSFKTPVAGKSFTGFKEALAFKESQGKYSKVNTFGCLGKYQFTTETLQSIGIKDSLRFLRSPKLQEKAFVALLSKNKWELKKEIEKYCGRVIGGIYVTESGILAAAHLGGVGSVKKFFKSNGRRQIRDGYGTSLKSYMKAFGGYETSGIIADSNAKVK